MFYLPNHSFVWKPVRRWCACAVTMFLKWPPCQSPNFAHVLASIWSQFISFQQKSGTGKSVKHCKSFRWWEVEQGPHDLWESCFETVFNRLVEDCTCFCCKFLNEAKLKPAHGQSLVIDMLAILNTSILPMGTADKLVFKQNLELGGRTLVF